MHYFSQKVNIEVKEVYWESFLNSIASSLVFIFEPIYLYSLGYSLSRIMWYYVMVYCCYAILIFAGARFASHFGYKHAIFLSNIFYVVYWLALFSVKAHPAMFFVAPVLFALQKSFYWPAYDSDIALSSTKIQRGREVGVLTLLMQVAYIIGPFLGGFVSEEFGFFALFALAGIIMLISAYPLFRSPEMYSKHDFRFRMFWKVAKTNARDFFGYFGYAEDLMIMSLWPVYVFIMIPGFLEVGAVNTVAAAIGTMLMLYVGKLADHRSKKVLIERASIFYGVTWVLRFAAKGLAPILTFVTLTKIGREYLTVPLAALIYEKAAKGGPDHAIAYSVFYEFSLSIGKVLTALAAIAIFAAGGSIYVVFALAGVLTLFYNFLKPAT